MISQVLHLKDHIPYLARFGLRSGILKCVHTLLGSNGIRSGQHLDKSMTLILVDNARLHSTETSEDTSYLTFCSTSTTYE